MNNQAKKIVLFVLLLTMTYLGYRFMIKPANQRFTEQKARFQAKSVKLAEFQKATVVAKDLNRQLEQLQEALGFFESKLPPKSQIYKVLEQVTVIAQKQGLYPKTIRTLNKKNNTGYIEQPLRMELTGNFSSFYSFLLELEKLDRIMKIRELTLEKQKDQDGSISANFIVSIFFQSS